MYLYICLNLFIFQRYIFQISSWTRNKNIPRSNYPFIFITYHQFSQTIIHPSIHTSHKQPIADNKLTLGILPDIGIHLAARGSTTLILSLSISSHAKYEQSSVVRGCSCSLTGATRAQLHPANAVSFLPYPSNEGEWLKREKRKKKKKKNREENRNTKIHTRPMEDGVVIESEGRSERGRIGRGRTEEMAR